METDKTSVNVKVAVYEKHQNTYEKADDVANEVPVSLVYNIIPYAVMMVSPADLEDFGIGFSLTENIIQDVKDIHHVHVQSSQHGMTVRLQISDDRFELLKEHRRNIVGRTGCGLCGIESLKQAIPTVDAVQSVNVSDEAIQKALADLKQNQPLQQMTGASHAAAWCDLQGNIQFVREDVGRHNALDKLIGAFIKMELSAQQGFVVVTSRASYEMVQKSAIAGFGCLVAVSAPTHLAIEQAEKCNLKLVGFGRDGRHLTYHNPFD